jgi:hypothetical protein
LHLYAGESSAWQMIQLCWGCSAYAASISMTLATGLVALHSATTDQNIITVIDSLFQLCIGSTVIYCTFAQQLFQLDGELLSRRKNHINSGNQITFVLTIVWMMSLQRS